MEKIKVREIDANGFFVKEALWDADVTLPPNMITSPVDGYFYKLKWDTVNSIWVEGQDPATILAAENAMKIAAINSECKEHIFAKYPIEFQLSCAQNLYPQAEKDACAQYINDCIAESNRLSDCVIAGTPAIPNWPI